MEIEELNGKLLAAFANNLKDAQRVNITPIDEPKSKGVEIEAVFDEYAVTLTIVYKDSQVIITLDNSNITADLV